jgi:hypothetical protein
MILTETPQLNIQVNYDAHYCQHFKNHESKYTLEIADWVTDKLSKTPKIKVDGKIYSPSNNPYEIKIPAGIGAHHIEIK